MPLIADCLLQEISLLANACDIFDRCCIRGILACQERCAQGVAASTATVTALVPIIGYQAAAEVAESAQKRGKTIREIVLSRSLMDEQTFVRAISPEAVSRLGSPDAKENHG
jgi:aspartate ammonia-lyase